MRHILAAAAVGVTLSISAAEHAADADPFLAGDALTAAVRERCGSGCVIFNRADAVSLERAIAGMLANAYDTGKAVGSDQCRL
jgi:hypothetical protein